MAHKVNVDMAEGYSRDIDIFYRSLVVSVDLGGGAAKAFPDPLVNVPPHAMQHASVTDDLLRRVHLDVIARGGC